MKNPQDAMYRELWEETGLKPEHVSAVGFDRQLAALQASAAPDATFGTTLYWSESSSGICCASILTKTASTSASSSTPEFDHWKWVDYWYPADNVVFFKRRVYQCALAQLELETCPARKLPD